MSTAISQMIRTPGGEEAAIVAINAHAGKLRPATQTALRNQILEQRRRVEAERASAKREARLAQDRAVKIEEKAREAFREATMSDFLERTRGNLTYREIYESDLKPTDQRILVSELDDQVAGKEKRLNLGNYGLIFSQVMDGTIQRDEFNDRVLPWLKGGISVEQMGTLNTLSKAVDKQNMAPVGKFIAFAKTQISGTTSMLVDPEGDKLFYLFSIEFGKRVAAAVLAGEVSLDELVDPSSPNFVGEEIINKHIRSPQDRMRSMAEQNRKPGVRFPDLDPFRGISPGKPLPLPTAEPQSIPGASIDIKIK